MFRPKDVSEEVLSGLKGQATVFQGDICDGVFITRVLSQVHPDEVYNLPEISFIPLSWERPGFVGEVNGSAVGLLLETIRINLPSVRFFQAGSSEMFSLDPVEFQQNEKTEFRPDNPTIMNHLDAEMNSLPEKLPLLQRRLNLDYKGSLS